MSRNTYLGDPKIVDAEELTIFEFLRGTDVNVTDADFNPKLLDQYLLNASEKGYAIYLGNDPPVWMLKKEFEKKYFKLGSGSTSNARNFNLAVGTKVGFVVRGKKESPNLVIMNAALTVLRDWAKYGLNVSKVKCNAIF